MKKILIVNNNMHLGGVQRSLVSLLWAIHGLYDVTLLLFSDAGECKSELPPEIKIETVTSAYKYLGMTKYDAKSLTDRLGRAFFAGVTRILGRKYAVGLMSLTQKRVTGYDAVISYLHNSGEKMFYGGCNDFVLDKADAAKKIAFLHCDYSACGADTPENAKAYSRFDLIAACSKGCADSFISANPKLKDKVRVVTNCHRFDKIRENAASSAVSLSKDKINIVTVARFGKEKSVDRAVEAVARLGELKDKIHYYIIGDGKDKALVTELIERYGLSDTVTLCGELTNPYGYIRSADLMLIPSRNEAAPLVVDESFSLGTPVLSTETSSAREMISDRGLGWVCDNSVDGIRGALAELICSPELLNEKKSALEYAAFDNADAVNAFCRLVNEIFP